MRREKHPEPPAHLEAVGAALWSATVAIFDFDPPALAILDALCTAADRRAAARAIVEAEGVCIADRFGQRRANPAVAIERDSVATMIRAAKILGVTLEPVR